MDSLRQGESINYGSTQLLKPSTDIPWPEEFVLLHKKFKALDHVIRSDVSGPIVLRMAC